MMLMLNKKKDNQEEEEVDKEKKILKKMEIIKKKMRITIQKEDIKIKEEEENSMNLKIQKMMLLKEVKEKENLEEATNNKRAREVNIISKTTILKESLITKNKKIINSLKEEIKT